MAVRYERLKQNKEIDLQDFEYAYDMFTEEDERITELKRIVSELPEPQRRVILIYASTASLKKVADLLNVSQPTIATMVNEIRQKIYKQYGKSHF
jgi:RNA polymerase sigma factor (sigma-70 family)